MAKYAIEESTLTAMGDKLRSLRGLSSKMTTDEMQGHLDTELANITAALSALTEKGVEVPEGATSDSLAALIEGIEAGGGDYDFSGINGLTRVVSGTYTPSSDSRNIAVPHGLGEVPKIIVICLSDEGGTSATRVCGLLLRNPLDETSFLSVVGLGSSSSMDNYNYPGSYSSSAAFYRVGETEFSIGRNYNATYFYAGATYSFIVGA